MENQKNLAPENWIGTRDIDQKMEVPDNFYPREDNLEQDKDPNDNENRRSMDDE